MTTPVAKNHRWGLVIPWAIAALIAFGWCGYWIVLQGTVRNALAAWSQAQAEATGRPGYAALTTGGFPLRLEVRLMEAALVDPRGAYVAATPVALAAVDPLNPQHVILSFPAPVALQLEDGAERLLTGDRVAASVRLAGDRLARASFSAEGLAIAASDAAAGQGLFFAEFGVHVRPDERNAADWQVAIAGKGIRFGSPVQAFEAFGQEMSRLQIGVVLSKAEALAAAGDPLELWRQAGGEGRLEALDIVWGPFTATGEGVLRLDAAHRLEGTLNLRPGDMRLFLDAMATEDDHPLAAILAEGLEASTVTLTAQAGVLRWQADTPLGEIAPQPLRTLGPIRTQASIRP